MEELYGSFDATGTEIFTAWTTDIRVQIKVDGDLPPGDKLLTLSAPYRSPLSLSQNEFVIKTIYSFLPWLPIILNIQQVVYVYPQLYFIVVQSCQMHISG